MSDEEQAKPVIDEKGRFLKGTIGGPGRPKGSRNKLGEEFIQALYADFLMAMLDAGVLAPNLSDFAVEPLFRRVEAAFANAAHDKGLRLRIVPTAAWIRSDAILIERILLNLVSNAVRYTPHGGIVVGCPFCTA